MNWHVYLVSIYVCSAPSENSTTNMDNVAMFDITTEAEIELSLQM